jgi:ADP-ribose pyrophosphatase YjhB (NUDIX family)
MKLLLQLEDVGITDVTGYRLRSAARAVALNSEGKIALMFVSNSNYYKLPGGGIEKGESLGQALAREMLEETGCEIEVVSDLGFITELRKESLLQISFCFLANIIKTVQDPQFTDSEKEGGFELHWVSFAEAEKLINSSPVKRDAHINIINKRDLCIVQEARKILGK